MLGHVWNVFGTSLARLWNVVGTFEERPDTDVACLWVSVTVRHGSACNVPQNAYSPSILFNRFNPIYRLTFPDTRVVTSVYDRRCSLNYVIEDATQLWHSWRYGPLGKSVGHCDLAYSDTQCCFRSLWGLYLVAGKLTDSVAFTAGTVFVDVIVRKPAFITQLYKVA